jgi:hypothetical protein
MEDQALGLQLTQDALQREADAVEHDLGLEELLGRVGRPVRVGSAALGLMVRRDLDVTVICLTLDSVLVSEVGARLARHPRVRQVVFRDDTGVWNTDPNYPDGLYLGLAYRSPSGHDWNLDIWFVDEPERQPDLAQLDSVPPRLNEERREAILRIKTGWSARPEYEQTVKSVDIYAAVLRDDVRALDQFDEWLATPPSSR